MKKAENKKDIQTFYVLGPKGSFSHQGAKIWTKKQNINAQFVFCSTFTEILTKTNQQKGTFGIFPVQNSSTSSVHENVDFFFQHPEDITIHAEYFLPIKLHILGNIGTKWQEITEIFSHPKAFAQCEQIVKEFTKNKGKITYANSTSEKTQHILQSKSKNKAILGNIDLISKGLSVIKPNVQDFEQNLTQFVIFSAKNNKKTQDTTKTVQTNKKISILFETNHKAGALSEILTLIAQKKGNLLKIESRPIPNHPETFRFWADIDLTNAKSDLITAIKQHTKAFYGLGEYDIGQILPIPEYTNNSLTFLRQKIDELDANLISILAERKNIVQEIKKVKQQMGKKVIDSQRFTKMMTQRQNIAKSEDINPELIEEIFETIHTFSVNSQQK